MCGRPASRSNAGQDVAKVIDGQAPTVVGEQEVGGSSRCAGGAAAVRVSGGRRCGRSARRFPRRGAPCVRCSACPAAPSATRLGRGSRARCPVLGRRAHRCANRWRVAAAAHRRAAARARHAVLGSGAGPGPGSGSGATARGSLGMSERNTRRRFGASGQPHSAMSLSRQCTARIRPRRSDAWIGAPVRELVASAVAVR